MVGGTRFQATTAAAAVQQQTTFGSGVAGIGGGLAGLADHAAAASPAMSTSRRSSGSLKREHPDDGDTEGNGNPHPDQPDGADRNSIPLPDGRKRRAGAGSGSRGVANLTPEQLAKKRANDREAQRAIRERTRNEIESLKRRIEELTNQKPYQELQAAIKAKEAVEAENAEIKQRLATVIGMLQPLLGPGAVAGVQNGLSVVTNNHAATPPISQQAPSSGYMTSQALLSAESPSNHILTPNGTASPVGSVDIPSCHTQRHHQLKHSQDRHQQWQQNMAPALGTGNSSRSFSIQTPNGTQVSPGFQQNQVSSHFAEQTQHQQHIQQAQVQQLGHQHPQQQETHLPQLEDHQYPQQPQSQQLQAAIINTNLEASLDPDLDPSLHPRLDPRLYSATPTNPNNLTMTCGYSQQSNPGGNADRHEEVVPNFSTPVKNCSRTCPLDGMLQDTLQERRQRTAEGLAQSEVTGPRYPSVHSLLNPSATRPDGRTLHPISKVFTDIVHAFPHMTGEPERIAIHFIMSLYLRWQVNPTSENYEYLPCWIRPLVSQLTLSHPVWLDYCPFPLMRDKLVRDFAKADAAGLRSYWMTDDAKGSVIMGDSSTVKHHNAPYLGGDHPVPFDLFAGVYTDTISLNWPHTSRSSLLESTDSSNDPIITPAFESHLRNLDNWTLGPEFFLQMPHLRGLANLKTADGQIILTRHS